MAFYAGKVTNITRLTHIANCIWGLQCVSNLFKDLITPFNYRIKLYKVVQFEWKHY